MILKLYQRLLVVALVAALALLATPIAAQTPPPLPLAGASPYAVGFKKMEFKDDSRDGRIVPIMMWYPAIAPQKPTADQTKSRKSGWLNAAPDYSAAPYPLILSSPAYGDDAATLAALDMPLTSQGFVVVAISHPNDEQQTSFVDRPLDLVFVLDQLAAIDQRTFGKLLQTNRVDVMGHPRPSLGRRDLWDNKNTGLKGFSYGAYSVLSMTGAAVDPASGSTWGTTSKGSSGDSNPRVDWSDWNWDQLTTYRAKFSPLKSDELWPPYTDRPILAALMFSPCYSAMFGDRGLAAATVPSLIVAGTNDTTCPYKTDAAYIFAHLGSQDRYLLSVTKADHFSYLTGKYLPVMVQMETAFFGYYLKGQTDYTQYLTAQYIDGVAAQLKLGLLWGPSSAK